MAIDISKIGSLLFEKRVGLSRDTSVPLKFKSIKLTGEGDFGRNEDDNFSYSISVHNDFAVIGVPYQDYDENGQNVMSQAGSAYIFKRTNDSWVFFQKISAPSNDRNSNNQFGYSVSIFDDIIVIGSPFKNENTKSASGAIFIYKYNLINFEFVEKIIPTGDNSTNINDNFGYSVSYYNDILLVSSPNHRFNLNGDSNVNTQRVLSGATWVFKYDNNSFTQIAKLTEPESLRNSGDQFGYSFDYDNNILAVGTPYHGVTNDGNFILNTGAVFVFEYNSLLNDWNFIQKINSINPQSNENFGYVVKLSNNFLAVSSKTPDGHGYVSIFSRSDWTFDQRIDPILDNFTFDSYEVRVQNNSGFGKELCFKDDLLIIGQPDLSVITTELVFGEYQNYDNIGSVHIYTNTDGWNLIETLRPIETHREYFGFSIDKNDSIIIIGSPGNYSDDTNTNSVPNAGSVYVYDFDGNNTTLIQKIVARGNQRNPGDNLGSTVVLKDNNLYVTASGHDYDSDNYNYKSNSGAVYHWIWSGSHWIFSQKITPIERESNDAFGYSISTNNNYLFISSINYSFDINDNSTNNSGAVFVFGRSNNKWVQVQKIIPQNVQNGDNFGLSLTCSNDWLVIGSKNGYDIENNNFISSAGKIYIYGLINDEWTLSQTIVSNLRNVNDIFGYRAQINGNLLLVSSPSHGYDTDNTNFKSQSGACWLYFLQDETWSLIDKLTGQGSHRNIDDFMGWSISSYMNKIAIGIPYYDFDINGKNYKENSGIVIVYKRYFNNWIIEQQITQPSRTSWARFGWSVKITGNELFIGSPGDRYINGDIQIENGFGKGSVYVYNFTSEWEHTQTLIPTGINSDVDNNNADLSASTYKSHSRFGWSLDCHNNNLIISQPWSCYDNNNEEKIYCGRVYIFEKILDSWQQSEILSNSDFNDSNEYDNFGYSLSIYDNNVIIGVPSNGYDASNSNYLEKAGSAYYYNKIINWQSVQKISPSTQNRNENDNLGKSLFVKDGLLVISSPNHGYDISGANYVENAGALFVWKYENNIWNYSKKIVAQDRLSGDRLGETSVLIDDDYIYTSSIYHSLDGNNENFVSESGCVFIFDKTTLEQVAKIVPTIRSDNDHFGFRIVTNDTQIFISSPDASSYNGQTINSCGCVFVFDKTTFQQTQIIHSNIPITNEHFGYSIDVKDNIFIIGSPFSSYDNDSIQSLSNQGGIWLFSYQNDEWNFIEKITSTPVDRQINDNFGYSVKYRDNYLFVSAINHSYDDKGFNKRSKSGAVYVWKNINGLLVFEQKISSPNRNINELFGFSIDANSTHLVIGAPGHTTDENGINPLLDSGSVFVYKKQQGNIKRRRKIIFDIEEFTIPSNILGNINVKMFGGGGASGLGSNPGNGGGGSYVEFELNVSENDVLKLLPGKGGKISQGGLNLENRFNGGQGGQGSASVSSGGGGGGSSVILLNGSVIAVAAGGGGGGGDSGAGSNRAGKNGLDGDYGTQNQTYTRGRDASDSISGGGSGGGGSGYYAGVAGLPVSDGSGGNSGSGGLSYLKNDLINPVIVKGQNNTKIYQNQYKKLLNFNTLGSPNSGDGAIILEWIESSESEKFILEKQLVSFGTNSRNINDKFGFSVCINDNNIIGVGSPYHGYDSSGSNYVENSGAVFVYQYVENNWLDKIKLVPSGLNSRTQNDNFGFSTCITNDWLLIGSPYHGYDSSGSNYKEETGAVFAYSIDETNQISFVQKIFSKGSVTEEGDNIGYSSSYDNNIIVIGSPNHSFDENITDNGYKLNSGAVFIWEKISNNWTFTQKITAPVDDRHENDNFGFSVKLKGNYLLISSPNYTNNYVNEGKVYLFKRNTKFDYIDSYYSPDPKFFGNFGYSLEATMNDWIISQPTNPSSGSIEFNKNIDQNLTFDFNQNMSNNFTIEFFVKFKEMNISEDILSTSDFPSSQGSFRFKKNISNHILFSFIDYNNDTREIDLGIIKEGRWNYVCVTHDTSTIKGYLNTNYSSSIIDSITIFDCSSQALVLGNYLNDNTSPLNGFIDELRISSTNRYPIDINYPDQKFIGDEDTLFLHSFDYQNDFKDYNNNSYINLNYVQLTSGLYEEILPGKIYVYGINEDSLVIKQQIIANYTTNNITDKFGYSLSSYEDILLVGDPFRSYDSNEKDFKDNSGLVSVYRNLSNEWTLLQKISSSGNDLVNSEKGGFKVSGNNNLLVVSAPKHPYNSNGEKFMKDSGAVYVWRRDGNPPTWKLEQKITPPEYDRHQYDQFGSNICLDNNLLVVSSPYHSYSEIDVLIENGGQDYQIDDIVSSNDYSFRVNELDYDQYFDDVVTLVKSNGNVYNSLIDVKGHEWNVGDVDVVDGKFGNAFYFPPNATGINPTATLLMDSSFNIGTNDFTIEFFMRGDTYNPTSVINFGDDIIFSSNAISLVHVWIPSTISMSIPNTYKSNDPTHWHHICFVRNNNTMMLFCDGRIIDSRSIDGSMNIDLNGILSFGNSGCYLENFRFTKNIARYVHDFDVSCLVDFQETQSGVGSIKSISLLNENPLETFSNVALVGGSGSGATISTGINIRKRTNAGAVWIYKRVSNNSSNNWNFVQKITPKGNEIDGFISFDNFGYSLACQDNTGTIVVGSPYNSYNSSYSIYGKNVGSAWCFKFTDKWIQDQKISMIDVKNGLSSETIMEDDNFGYSLDVRDNILVIGAPNHSYDTNGFDFKYNSGSAYLWTRQSSDGDWTYTQKLVGWGQDKNSNDQYGYSIASHNNTLVIGAPGYSYDENSLNYKINAGIIYVFTFSDNVWSLQQRITSPTRTENEYFGKSVDVYGEKIVVGVPDYNGDYQRQGCVYVFNRNNQAWNYEQQLLLPDNANNIDDMFGWSVKIYETTIGVGCPYHGYNYDNSIFKNNAGSVFVYVKEGLNPWELQQKITPTGTNNWNDDDNFGFSLSLEENILVVGSPNNSYDMIGQNYIQNTGSTFVFSRDGVTWIQLSKIVPTGEIRNSFDNYGFSISYSNDIMVIGAPKHSYDANDISYKANSGMVYAYKLENGTFSQFQRIVSPFRVVDDYFGDKVCLDGNKLVISSQYHSYDSTNSNYLLNSGAVWFYEFDGIKFNYVQKIVKSNRQTNDRFGFSIDVNNNNMIIGSPGDGYDQNGSNFLANAGSVSIYKYVVDSFSFVQKVIASGTNGRNENDMFGYSVSIEDNYAIVGAPYHSFDINGINQYINTGTVFLLKTDDHVSWDVMRRIGSWTNNRNDNENFGESIDVSKNNIISGVPGNNYDINENIKNNSGNVVIYQPDNYFKNLVKYNYLNFIDGGEYVSLENIQNDMNQSSNISISVDMKINVVTTPGYKSTIYSITKDQKKYVSVFLDDSGTLCIGTDELLSGTQTITSSGYQFDNNWNNIIILYDNSSIKVYINSIEVISLDTSLDISNSLHYIGVAEDTLKNDYINAYISDIAVWNRSLSESEILDINNGTKPDVLFDNILGYWLKN